MRAAFWELREIRLRLLFYADHAKPEGFCVEKSCRESCPPQEIILSADSFPVLGNKLSCQYFYNFSDI